jgi:hypothetical protein
MRELFPSGVAENRGGHAPGAAIGAAVAASADPGDRDPPFGDGGVVLTDFGSEESGRTAVIQADREDRRWGIGGLRLRPDAIPF